jgi:threonine dehydrogenase-like Zn-dependent dehydrogenase
MRAVLFGGRGDVEVAQRPAPTVRDEGDAVVRITMSCVCGSDLWAYRGVAERPVGQPLGHEFIGVVESVGASVRTVVPGDLVISPFSWSDGTCAACRSGWPTSCPNRGFWGRTPGADGAQAELIRVSWADGTLVPIRDTVPDDRHPALLALGDVLATGHHAAVSAGVTADATVAVVGDGAVGLCAVLAARRLGADRVLLLSRHDDRAAVGRQFGAEVVQAGPADDPVSRILELTAGRGADATLECVGTEDSLRLAVALTRDGGNVGFVGVPHGVERLPVNRMFSRNIGLRGGIAPARAYIDELLPEVLDGRLDPRPVFDRTLPLDEASKAYELMDRREAIKVILVP